MTLEEIRAFFVSAKNFVKIGNPSNIPMIIASIQAISDEVKEIYKTASVIDKVKCKLLIESIENVVNALNINGIKDKGVLAFFGLAESSAEAPSFFDILSGKYAPKDSNPFGGGDSDGGKPADVKPFEANPYIPPQPIPVEKVPYPTLPTENPADKYMAVNPTYTPDSLRNFIGQEHIKKALLKEIAIAKNEGRKHLDNILLFGNPGLGKTTLMELIAKELGVKFELLDCSQFRNSQQSLKALQTFFMRIARDNEPVVIALDEIHMLNDELQSSLLTLLNNRVYVSPLDVNGNSRRIPIDEFTFIAATTDDDKVLDTIKNRCLRLKFQMIDYSYEELKQIYRNKVAAKGLTITEGAIDMCIPRSRGAIRYVNSIVEGLNNALYNDEGQRVSTHIDIQVAYNYFEEKGIDPMGLEAKDLEILRTIQNEPSGVIGLEVLAARVGLDAKKYMSEYERYLIKIGFVNIANRGRSLTEAAIKYLNSNGGCSAKSQDESQESGDIIDDLFRGRK